MVYVCILEDGVSKKTEKDRNRERERERELLKST